MLKKRAKPPGMSQSDYDSELAADIAAVQREYGGGGGDMSDSDDEERGVGDAKSTLLAALEAEIKCLARHQQNARTAVRQGKPNPYGEPLETSKEVRARYEFWPSVKGEMPLLYFCAEELLAGSSNSTTFNERLHSPAGYIYNNLRARLKPDTVERLTLAQHFLRKLLLSSLDKDREEQERKAVIDEQQKAAAAAAADEAEDEEEGEEEEV